MKNKTPKIILCFFSLAVLWACNQKNDLKIGVVGAETPNGFDGKLQRRGVELAINEINSSGLLDGQRKITVIFNDSKSDPNTAISILNKSIDIDQINFFIGDVQSSITKAMIPVIDKRKAFLFSPWSGADSLGNSSQFFARNYPSANLEATFAANYAVNTLKALKAGVIYINNDWGKSLQTDFCNEIKKLNGTIVFNKSYYDQNSALDFKTLISSIDKTNTELIYLAGYPKDMGILAKQLKELNINMKIIANTSFLDNQCLVNAGAASEGIIIPTPDYDPKDSTIQSIKKFYKVFKLKYPNDEPTHLDANAYDAVMLIKDGYNKFGNEPQKIAAYIRNLKNYAGAAGVYDFANGDVSVKIVVKKIIKGIPVLIAQQ